jgi:hypothetical protein
MAGLESGWIPVVRRLHFETGHWRSAGLDDSNGSVASGRLKGQPTFVKDWCPEGSDDGNGSNLGICLSRLSAIGHKMLVVGWQSTQTGSPRESSEIAA